LAFFAFLPDFLPVNAVIPLFSLLFVPPPPPCIYGHPNPVFGKIDVSFHGIYFTSLPVRINIYSHNFNNNSGGEIALPAPFMA
jgi:hypothetical protein